MARRRRLNIQGGIYHVMSRGNRKGVVFKDERDRERFTDLLGEAAERYAVKVYSECRMGNHYHMVVMTPRGNLSAFMRQVVGVFTQQTNRRHGLTGHLFGGRFKSLLVDDDLYLRVVLAYVARNPVAANLVEKPEDWPWCSFRASIGLQAAPPYLCLDWLEHLFPADSRSESQKRFCEYVAAPPADDEQLWLQRTLIGAPSLARQVRAQIGATLFGADVPRAYRGMGRPPLEQLLLGHSNKVERASAMLRSHVVHGYTMAEIARCLALHPGSVSRIVCEHRKRRSTCDKC